VAGRGTTSLLAREGIGYTLHPYEVDPRAPSHGEAAAAALGVDPAGGIGRRAVTRYRSARIDSAAESKRLGHIRRAG